jgi:hypothetical protein
MNGYVHDRQVQRHRTEAFNYPQVRSARGGVGRTGPASSEVLYHAC